MEGLFEWSNSDLSKICMTVGFVGLSCFSLVPALAGDCAFWYIGLSSASLCAGVGLYLISLYATYRLYRYNDESGHVYYLPLPVILGLLGFMIGWTVTGGSETTMFTICRYATVIAGCAYLWCLVLKVFRMIECYLDNLCRDKWRK